MLKSNIFVHNFLTGLMTFVLWILVLSTSITGTVKAECVPTPNCASIGYTETSCETQAVKCPFDTSKLFCLPCDSSYKYDCSGDNITGGTGSACGGKYISCTCSNGEWDSESETCKSAQNCLVGYIYYSDKTCSADYDSSKTVAGIVIKDNELIISKPINMTWSRSDYDIPELPEITTETDAINDVNGKNNTSIIVSYHTNNGETTSTSAALYCHNFTGDIGGTIGKWYLPSFGELYAYIYGHYNILKTTARILNWNYFDGELWSSTEISDEFVWILAVDYDIFYADNKFYSDRVGCFFNIS